MLCSSSGRSNPEAGSLDNSKLFKSNPKQHCTLARIHQGKKQITIVQCTNPPVTPRHERCRHSRTPLGSWPGESGEGGGGTRPEDCGPTGHGGAFQLAYWQHWVMVPVSLGSFVAKGYLAAAGNHEDLPRRCSCQAAAHQRRMPRLRISWLRLDYSQHPSNIV